MRHCCLSFSTLHDSQLIEVLSNGVYLFNYENMIFNPCEVSDQYTSNLLPDKYVDGNALNTEQQSPYVDVKHYGTMIATSRKTSINVIL